MKYGWVIVFDYWNDECDPEKDWPTVTGELTEDNLSHEVCEQIKQAILNKVKS